MTPLSEPTSATMSLTGYCLTCRKKHDYGPTPIANWLHRCDEWAQKHRGHNIEFRSKERKELRNQSNELEKHWSNANQGPWWLEDYKHNADIKFAYASSAAYTIDPSSLASSSTLVAGREGTAVSNATNLYLDYLLAGNITVGTTPTASTVIEVWAYGSQNDTPLYPDVFDGTDSAETVTSAAIKQSALAWVASMAVDAATSNRVYYYRPVSLAALYGFLIPKNHGLFITHSTVAALNATAGNHVNNYTGGYVTSS